MDTMKHPSFLKKQSLLILFSSTSALYSFIESISLNWMTLGCAEPEAYKVDMDGDGIAPYEALLVHVTKSEEDWPIWHWPVRKSVIHKKVDIYTDIFCSFSLSSRGWMMLNEKSMVTFIIQLLLSWLENNLCSTEIIGSSTLTFGLYANFRGSRDFYFFLPETAMWGQD